jgi:hypothetical protein
MRKIKSKRLDLVLTGSKSLLMRDMAKILSTINNLYNYYVFLSEPDVHEKVVSKLKKSQSKKKETHLYSSSFELAMGQANRMNILSISRSSPVKISLEGTSTAIDALRYLIELFMPVNLTRLQLEKRKKLLEIRSPELELISSETTLSEEQEKNMKELLSLTDNINSINIDDYLKKYMIDSVLRNIRSIETNPLKPMLS